MDNVNDRWSLVCLLVGYIMQGNRHRFGHIKRKVAIIIIIIIKTQCLTFFCSCFVESHFGREVARAK